MRAAGIIAEYNPFHNGHAYQIRKTRACTDCDCIIVAMNPSVSQRGEMMLADKWTRAHMALLSGADFVFELPTLFGVRPAEGFAQGGVSLLHGLGCQWLSFGCETEDIGLLWQIARLSSQETEEFQTILQKNLSCGQSFPKARASAVAQILALPERLLSAPNVVLAVEYLKALLRLGSNMEPVPVLRTVAHTEGTLAEQTSASAIRAHVLAGDVASVRVAMPPQAYALLVDSLGAVPSPDAVDALLLASLRNLDQQALSRLPDVGEGLENVLYRACRQSGTREDLLRQCKSKRYTYARLSRICMHALLNTDSGLVRETVSPPYARLLGCRRAALPFLPQLIQKSTLPIVIQGKMLKGDRCFLLEQQATNLRSLVAKDPAYRMCDRDFRQKFLIAEGITDQGP